MMLSDPKDINFPKLDSFLLLLLVMDKVVKLIENINS